MGHDPLVLHDGSMGMVKCAEGGAQAVAVAATASARVLDLDLEAEARRLDASIYPASTRKIGCVVCGVSLLHDPVALASIAIPLALHDPAARVPFFFVICSFGL